MYDCSVLDCSTPYSTIWVEGMCQLATRGPEGDSGNGNSTGVPELAVEEARRGSRIWLGLGGDLHWRS